MLEFLRTYWYIPTAYFIFINLWAFLAFGMDKSKAVKHRRRIPESFLMCLALAGGGLGALSAMYLFRHKTRHKKFTVGIPVILIFETALAVFILYKAGFGEYVLWSILSSCWKL